MVTETEEQSDEPLIKRSSLMYYLFSKGNHMLLHKQIYKGRYKQSKKDGNEAEP
jgi:hypothetical protein